MSPTKKKKKSKFQLFYPSLKHSHDYKVLGTSKARSLLSVTPKFHTYHTISKEILMFKLCLCQVASHLKITQTYISSMQVNEKKSLLTFNYFQIWNR